MNIAEYNVVSETDDCAMYASKLDWQLIASEGYFDKIEMIDGD